jgi:hypothetical protein
MAAVRDALPRLCLADDRDLLLRPACLGSKGAAAAPLAVQTMSDRHANRLSFASRLKLSAATCRSSARYAHARIPCPAESTNWAALEADKILYVADDRRSGRPLLRRHHPGLRGEGGLMPECSGHESALQSALGNSYYTSTVRPPPPALGDVSTEHLV